MSYAILKPFYGAKLFYWGWSRDNIKESPLALYKTGRTNANDGGIDFVMKPIGRFFQATETTDVRRYFLDIDGIQRFPITFVIKSEEREPDIREEMRKQAQRSYGVNRIVDRCMDCMEELVNIPILLRRFDETIELGQLSDVVQELAIQSRLEFNMPLEDIPS